LKIAEATQITEISKFLKRKQRKESLRLILQRFESMKLDEITCMYKAHSCVKFASEEN